jgi:hypothetical protein
VPARVAFLLGRSTIENETMAPLSPEIEAAAGASDVFARILAGAYARTGDIDSTMHWLEVAVGRGFINHPFLAELDPSLQGVRRDPRFVELMKVVRDRWERFES